MQNTKIEWCDSTWNPVTGCLHDCKYCYARGVARRFGGKGDLREYGTGFLMDEDDIIPHGRPESGPIIEFDRGCYEIKYPLTRGECPEPGKQYNGKITPYPFGFLPTFHRYLLGKPQAWKKPRTIFVGSMCDLFGDWVPDEWIKAVFDACAAAPQHKYLFLTKNPKRYLGLAEAEKLPKNNNFWYGSTKATPANPHYWSTDHNCFLSIEPLHSGGWYDTDNKGDIYLSDYFSNGGFRNIKLVIIGAETGGRKAKITPKKEWIDEITEYTKMYDIPVFMKDSLAGIVGAENMRRELPWQ
ncbi:MAG: phage Gp37/Gp68 family protein [Oscillospiraceae bacterium]|jgi:protein gp37|nr:phage Gp37/Gp68 family protein [Oscillospiraceae bacterium]